MTTREDLDLTVLVPFFNEEDNVSELHREIAEAVAGLGRSYELIYVDDGSTDATAARLHEVAACDPHVVVLRFARNYGQTQALQAGFDHARGRVVITLDGDRQNDPRDFAKLLDALDENTDVVSGRRRNRRDSWPRRLVSGLGNAVIRRVSGVRLRDSGCTLKAYRRREVRRHRLYSDMHRFIPAIVGMGGGTWKEVPVNHRPREKGVSKYGFSRLWKVPLDVVLLVMLLRFASRPGLWFTLVSLPFWILQIVFLTKSALIYFTASPSGVNVVYPGIAMVLAFASLHLVIMAFVGELVVWTAEDRDRGAAVREVLRLGQEKLG